MTYAVDVYESSVSSIVPFSFFSFSPLQGYESNMLWMYMSHPSLALFLFFCLAFRLSMVMSLINMTYAVDGYESSVSSIVPFFFLCFPPLQG